SDRPVARVHQDSGAPDEAAVSARAERDPAVREVEVAEIPRLPHILRNARRASEGETEIDAVGVGEREERGGAAEVREVGELARRQVAYPLVVSADLVVHAGGQRQILTDRDQPAALDAVRLALPLHVLL